MEDAENAIEKLVEIRKSGVQLSIDDFGTGYSSLSYLRRFPVDFLKIDRSFVSDLEEAAENDEIVRTIMALANSLNLSVVAEGIESVQQLTILRRLGCQFGQGFLFAPPLPVAARRKHERLFKRRIFPTRAESRAEAISTHPMMEERRCPPIISIFAIQSTVLLQFSDRPEAATPISIEDINAEAGRQRDTDPALPPTRERRRPCRSSKS